VVASFVAGVLFVRHEKAPTPAPAVSASVVAPAPAPEEEPEAPAVAAASDDAAEGNDQASPLAEAGPDATNDAFAEGAPVVIRMADLMIRSAVGAKLCVDAPKRGQALQLYSCHGRKNQRWTFAQDATGTSQIYAAVGGCIRAATPGGDGTRLIGRGVCNDSTPHFRNLENGRLQEVTTTMCLTAPVAEKRARIFLAPCNPANAGQGWTLSR
jgi:hypothetical protein